MSARAKWDTNVRKKGSMPVYRGPHPVSGLPIMVALATIDGSNARKITGMLQIFLFSTEARPMAAAQAGLDAAVCGDCPLRPNLGDGCYVNLGKGSPKVYESCMAQEPDMEGACRAIRAAVLDRGMQLRIGPYGDPALIPMDVLERLVGAATDESGRFRGTMYTRRWRSGPAWLRRVARASVFTDIEETEARALGWLPFRVMPPNARPSDGAIPCPGASWVVDGVELQRAVTNCEACGLCSGTDGPGGMIGKSGQLRLGRTIAVQAHGTRAANVEAAIARLEEIHRLGGAPEEASL